MKQQMLEDAVDTLLKIIHRFEVGDMLTQEEKNKLRHIQTLRDHRLPTSLME